MGDKVTIWGEDGGVIDAMFAVASLGYVEYLRQGRRLGDNVRWRAVVSMKRGVVVMVVCNRST